MAPIVKVAACQVPDAREDIDATLSWIETYAEKSDRKKTKGNEVHLTFPPSDPVESGPAVPAPPKPKNGAPYTPPPHPPKGSSCRPTFTHPDPDFPDIEAWWWTHKRWNEKRKDWEEYEGTRHKGTPTGWEHE